MLSVRPAEPDVKFVEIVFEPLVASSHVVCAWAACSVARPATIARATRAQAARRDERCRGFDVCMAKRLKRQPAFPPRKTVGVLVHRPGRMQAF